VILVEPGLTQIICILSQALIYIFRTILTIETNITLYGTRRLVFLIDAKYSLYDENLCTMQIQFSPERFECFKTALHTSQYLSPFVHFKIYPPGPFAIHTQKLLFQTFPSPEFRAFSTLTTDPNLCGILNSKFHKKKMFATVSKKDCFFASNWLAVHMQFLASR